jgi:hypothetical protein
VSTTPIVNSKQEVVQAASDYLKLMDKISLFNWTSVTGLHR